MIQQEKDLLLKDLCARLPYGVFNEHKLKSCKFGAKSMVRAHDIDAIERGQYDFYKPYLFPLSSMTDEQKLEYYGTFSLSGDISGSVDFYNKYHLDWRGLIPMGLAIDATGLNIY